MRFFIPDEPDAAKAEERYEAIKKFASNTMKWEITDRRIFRLTFKEEGKECQAQVGKQDPITGEIIVAILESNAYLVCTPNRFLRRGEPLMVGREEARWVEEFEK
jgi:hypothetical protein